MDLDLGIGIGGRLHASPPKPTVKSMAHFVQDIRHSKLEAIMKNDERSRYLTRDRVLNLLSDDEIASVSTAESAPQLRDGDEYLDLEALDQGVRRAPQTATPMGQVLPRKAVQEDTWRRILRELAGAAVSAPPSGRRTNDSY